MEEDQVRQEILEARAQLETADAPSFSSTNPLSHFRYKVIRKLELNGFDKSMSNTSYIHAECDQILDFALTTHDYEMFEQVLWYIKDEDDQYNRRALITRYLRVCCCLTDEALNDAVDQLLEYLHQDIESTWRYDIGFLFELLHECGVNVEKFIALMNEVQITDLLNDVQLKFKLNCDSQTKSQASASHMTNAIKRVFRIILSLGYFQVEKLKSTLSDDDYLFLFLLGFYLQLDKRFQDINIIHIARRLMVNTLTLLTAAYWNEKRDMLVGCLYKISAQNVYIGELFLKTNERTVRIRTQLALLHLKRLVNMVEHAKKSEAMIMDEIIRDKLTPRAFTRSVDFIDCVRLLGDIIDSYPHNQQQEYLKKLYDRIQPYANKSHERFFSDEEHLILFGDCQRWRTILEPYSTESDFQKRLKRI